MRLSKKIRLLLAALFMVPFVAYAAVTVTVNGSNHTIPQTNERGWGTNVTAWIQAISQFTLQPSGGTFTLTAEVNTGATYGFKVPYIKTATSTPSTAGVLRLARTDAIGWRNAGDSANLLLEVDSSNRLTFNSVIIPTASSASVQDSTFSIYDNSDNTKLIAFQASAITTGTTRTITMADANVDLADVAGATSSNTASRIVKRDGSGNFSAGTVTASLTGNVTGNLTGNVTGNADTATALASNPSDCASDTYATAIAASGNLTCGTVTNAGLAGSIAASKLVGTDIATVGTITSGTWSGTTIAINKGGSGQTTANAALNAFLPTQSGNANKFLKTDGTDTSWASPTGAPFAVTSKTTTYTASTSDDVILVSTTGGAWTLSLYAASGNSGKVLRIKKTTNDFTALTIDGNSSETIDGATTTTLNTQYEQITLICDGSNWHILERSYPQAWVAYTPTFTGFGTAASIEFEWRRVGDSIEIQGNVTSGTSTATEARISLPSGLTSRAITSLRIVGQIQINNTSGTALAVGAFASVLIEPSVTYMTFAFRSNSTNGLVKRNGDEIGAAGVKLSLFSSVPITGWN